MNIRQEENIARLQDFLFNSDVESEVRQGEWKLSNNRLRTISVATCLAIAAHNRISGSGILGHFSGISPTSEANVALAKEQFDGRTFEEAVNFLPELGPMDETKIWLGGVAIYASDDRSLRQSKLADRLFAETKINEVFAKRGITNTGTISEWNTDENDLCVELDIKTGILHVQPYAE